MNVTTGGRRDSAQTADADQRFFADETVHPYFHANNLWFDLAQLRDHVLAKRWNDDKYNQEVDKLKDKIDDVLKQASGETVSNDDY